MRWSAACLEIKAVENCGCIDDGFEGTKEAAYAGRQMVGLLVEEVLAQLNFHL